MTNGLGSESPFILLSHLYRDAERLFSRRIGMSVSRLHVIHELMHAGELSQAELQQRLGMEGALLTRFVKQMESAGLITRRPDPKDNRYTLVTLAESGKAELNEIDRKGDEFQEQLLEGVSEEEHAALVQTLRRIQENLSRMER